ncbi:MAG: T9SS type A sorting domain-containing protein [Kaistella sp.]
MKTAAVEKGSTLNVSSLPKGIYIVTGNVGGQVVSQKITKN